MPEDPHAQARRCLWFLEDIRMENDIVLALRASRELVLAARALEERVVRLCRNKGWSWHVIASWMGLSPQAVHKRWRRRFQGNEYDPMSWRRKDKWNEKYGLGG